MKRLRLSAKLALAIIPIGLVALLAAGFIAYTFLNDSKEQNETAHAATVTADAIATLDALWTEEELARQVYVFGDTGLITDLDAAKVLVGEALAQLDDSVDSLQGASRGFFKGVADSVSDDVREIGLRLDEVRSITPPTSGDLLAYHDVADGILSLLPKSSSIVSNRVQARELSTAYFLAEGGQVSLEQEQLIKDYRVSESFGAADTAALEARSSLDKTLEGLEEELGAWALRANQTANEANAAILRYTRLPEVDIDTFPLARNEDILTTSEQLANGVAAESSANATASEREALFVAAVAAVVILIAFWGAYAVVRSVVRRVRGVTSAAVEVSEVDLPNLVEALQDPSRDISQLRPTEILSAGNDEVGDLANSFILLHKTLIEVAGQQMDILRKGVSEIFVTLARRNRSLVDRQLALLDELELREEDAETLGGYYKLDHLATRMRRNAESLLVLAGTEPTRIWSNPLEVGEIIRAALGEVDDYKRVDIMALEPALVSGGAVADIAHLMSELLDNGTQYSSPSDRVRVAGLFDPAGYMLTVSDTGIGMSDGRLLDLNELLESPPVLGLALEPTLGMYVVARLAARHGIKVQLIAGAPGLTVRVMLPKELIEPAKPKEEFHAPVKSMPPTFATPSEHRPSVNGSFPTPSSPEVTTSSAPSYDTAGSNGHAPIPEPALEDDLTSGLPGSVKGKHEHPKRPGGLLGDRQMDDKSPSYGQEPIDRDAGDRNDSPFRSPDTTANGLTRRVPGEALKSERFADEDHRTVESPPAKKAETTPAKRAETTPAKRAETTPAKKAAPTPNSDEPWWVAAEEVREVAPAPEASPFEFWDSDFEAPDAPEDRSEDPPRPVLSGAGLPVRTPGTSFKDTEDRGASATASESGAMGIRSALASFEDGRGMAQVKNQSDDPENNESTEEGES